MRSTRSIGTSAFKPTRRFLQRKGRWMNEYVINGMEAGNNCETHL